MSRVYCCFYTYQKSAAIKEHMLGYFAAFYMSIVCSKVSGKVGTAHVKNLQLSRKIYHKTTMSTQHLLHAHCRLYYFVCILSRQKQMKTCHKAESRFLRRGCNDRWHDTKFCQTQGQEVTHRVTNLLMLLKLVCATKIDIKSGFVQLSSQLVSCSLIVDTPGVQGA